MTQTQLFQTALTRVRGGESMRSVISSLYTTWRRYKETCSVAERAQLKSARMEYKALNRVRLPAPNQSMPRFIAVTTPELFKAVADHCKQKETTVARFINSAIYEALNRAKS